MRRFVLLSLLLTLAVSSVFAVTPVDGVIEGVRRQLAPDRRQTVYEVEAAETGPGYVKVSGRLSDVDIYNELKTRLSEFADSARLTVVDDLTLLPHDQWGLINVSVACMRTAGKYSAELATQAIMGMPVRLLDEVNGWWLIQSPDGYLGWVWRSSIANKTASELDAWRSTPRLVVTSYTQIPAYAECNSTLPRGVVSDLVPGAIVEGSLNDICNGRVEVILPDGRKAWADADALTPIEQWAARDFDAQVILDRAYSMMGAPYLWGGTSPKATDCSGLVKVSYLSNGLILRRDASQQQWIGSQLEPADWRDFMAGDLLFFSERADGRATHVGIYDKDGVFIHCASNVHLNSIDPDQPDFVNRKCVSATRIHGSEGTDGITYVRDHPWYFDNK